MSPRDRSPVKTSPPRWPSGQDHRNQMSPLYKLICVAEFNYLTALDREEASPNLNHKYQTCLMFTTPYLAASVVIQLEQTSITYRMLRVSNAATWQPQTCHESRIYHPYSFYTLFFPGKQNRRAS